MATWHAGLIPRSCCLWASAAGRSGLSVAQVTVDDQVLPRRWRSDCDDEAPAFQSIFICVKWKQNHPHAETSGWAGHPPGPVGVSGGRVVVVL